MHCKKRQPTDISLKQHFSVKFLCKFTEIFYSEEAKTKNENPKLTELHRLLETERGSEN